TACKDPPPAPGTLELHELCDQWAPEEQCRTPYGCYHDICSEPCAEDDDCSPAGQDARGLCSLTDGVCYYSCDAAIPEFLDPDLATCGNGVGWGYHLPVTCDQIEGGRGSP